MRSLEANIEVGAGGWGGVGWGGVGWGTEGCAIETFLETHRRRWGVSEWGGEGGKDMRLTDLS